MQAAVGYRDVARPDAYDPSRRARPCDACGAGLFVGESEGGVTCPACRHEQAIPAARALQVPASPAGDEATRLAHLATQREHEWLIPSSVVRFGGNVLEEEIGEARALWATLRKRVEARPDDREAAIELMTVAFALHGALPAESYDERLARRALAESSAEAQADPLLRQKTLYNLVMGAVRAGELAHARGFIARMDPRSRGLDADSSYRVSAAVLATALRDPAEVLKLLGRDDSSLPIHKSSRVLAATLRADALEKLGSLEAAVDGLYAEVQRRHGALAAISELVATLPAEWALCEKSLPLTMERDRDRLAENVPPRTAAVFPLAMAAIGLLGAALALLDGAFAIAAGSTALLCAAAATGIAVRDKRRRFGIVRGCRAVRGRVLRVRALETPIHALEVVVERDGMPDVQATTLQPLNARLRAINLENRTFDALWNPEHPTYFPRITIHVSAEDVGGKN